MITTYLLVDNVIKTTIINSRKVTFINSNQMTIKMMNKFIFQRVKMFINFASKAISYSLILLMLNSLMSIKSINTLDYVNLCQNVTSLKGKFVCGESYLRHADSLMKHHVFIDGSRVDSKELYDSINIIMDKFFKNKTNSLIELTVRKSVIGGLTHGLPVRLNGSMFKLIFRDTTFNVEAAFRTIRKSVSLNTLDTLAIINNENLSKLPEKLFENMNGLKELELSKTKLDKMNDENLRPLINSLLILNLEDNLFKQFPSSILKLKELEEIYFYGNSPLEDEIQGLDSMKQLRIFSIQTKCTCNIGLIEFFTLLKSRKIDGAECSEPLKFKGRSVFNLTKEVICQS